MRQCPSRYVFRAGRNLPDKELRYLRTVIVTAAVNRGFDSRLPACALTSPFNLPAPSRRQTVYSDVMSLHSPVFLVNSRLDQFSATSFRFIRKELHDSRLPLFRSYGVNLPSSLTKVHSSALGFSPRLPVSVLVRIPNTLTYEDFLVSVASATCALRPPSLLGVMIRWIYLPDPPTSLALLDHS